jgi:hypothetical protein
VTSNVCPVQEASTETDSDLSRQVASFRARADNHAVQSELGQPLLSQEYRWRALLSWRIVPTFWATGLAAGGAAELSAGEAAKVTGNNVVVMVIGVAAVIVVWAWVVCRLWRACVVLTSASAAADTVVVQGWFADHRIPVSQIMEVRANHRYGPVIHTIDGCEIGFIALSPPWFTDRSYAPQRDMVATLTRAARAASAAHPEEAEALLQANVPLRAGRDRRRIIQASVTGLGMLVVGLIAPGGRPLAVAGGVMVLTGLGALYLGRTGKGSHSRR